MAQFKTLSGQTIWDLSLELYGDTSNAVKIIQDNPTLGFIGKHIPPGTVVEYDEEAVTNLIVDFYRTQEIDPSTGSNNANQGSGFDLGFKINGFY